MLRVSKQAIIYTEPHDYAPAPFIRKVLQKIKHIFNDQIDLQKKTQCPILIQLVSEIRASMDFSDPLRLSSFIMSDFGY